jgi:hypothetical protein
MHPIFRGMHGLGTSMLYIAPKILSAIFNKPVRVT